MTARPPQASAAKVVVAASLLVVVVALLSTSAGAGTGLDVRRVNSGAVTVPAGQSAGAEAVCPGTTRAIGGGYAAIANTPPSLEVGVNRPANNGRKWLVVAFNPGATDGTLNAYAICTETS